MPLVMGPAIAVALADGMKGSLALKAAAGPLMAREGAEGGGTEAGRRMKGREEKER